VSDAVLRLLLVVAIVVAAAAVAWVASRFRRPPHPTVTVGDIGDRPGVVVFTSTNCSTCREARGVLEEMRVPFREVTSELEQRRFEEWGVVAVPLIVVIDEGGGVVETYTGIPRRGALRRSISIAGVSAR